MNRKKNGLVRSVWLIILFSFWGKEISADGLPGEYLLTDRWRTFFSTISPLHNPTNLMDQNFPSVRGVITLSGFDIAKLYELGITYPVGMYQSVGFTIVGESGNEIENWRRDETGYSKGNNKMTFSSSHLTFTYTTNLWRGLDLGANIGVLLQSDFERKTDYNLNLDFGLSYRIIYHHLFGLHKIGLTFRNIPINKNTYFNRIEQSPVIRGNYTASFLQNKINYDIGVILKDYNSDPKKFYNQQNISEWDVMASFSLWPYRYAGLKGFVELNHDRGLDALGFAVAFNLPSYNRGRDMALTCQYNSQTNTNLQGTISLYGKHDFGLHREEIYSRKMARLISLIPGDLYSRAMNHYYKGNQWEALILFTELINDYSEFYLVDMASYYAASCLRKLDMKDKAKEMFIETKLKYPKSDAYAYSNLGLMRVHYSQKNFTSVVNQFVELNDINVPDSIKAHGSYLMGQMQLENDQLLQAVGNLSTIASDHPDYLFALLSKAVAMMIFDPDDQSAAEYLETITQYPAKSRAEQEAVNRAWLLFGYLLYEQGDYSKAAISLKNIPSNSYYYEEALLGKLWAAQKLENIDDCLNISHTLTSTTNNQIILADALLLEGYGYLRNRNYQKAEEILESANDLLQQYVIFSNDSLDTKNEHYHKNRSEVNEVGNQLIIETEKGTRRDDNYVNNLKKNYDDLMANIVHYQEFINSHQRELFFARNKKAVHEDIKYLLALLTEHRISGTMNQHQMDNLDEADDIELELEKLRKKMEELEID
ncbi:tetratricopeptide repeat protein [Chitinispirillales bacterium ANBcel5]|uniref:tetratricopeptide repeat protein n=1 Tax=Cellulosispirillum alkaliphilum TaxID=3039283 RepID=UPI002A54233E|nr:tetratricopeptide repeat protein [Chitinispirillales bacterium ANBcel5]